MTQPIGARILVVDDEPTIRRRTGESHVRSPLKTLNMYRPTVAAIGGIGYAGVTISAVKGHGRQKGIKQVYREVEYTIDFAPKARLELIVDDDSVDRLVDCIAEHARTGAVGDGKIWVTPVDSLSRVRTAEDRLYELLLKSGFPLTTPVETLEIEGKTVYSIAGGEMLVCLDKDLTLEAMRAMAARKPSRVVCLDEGFAANDQLKTNAVQTFKDKNVHFQTV